MAYVNTSRAASFGLVDRAVQVLKTVREGLERRRVYQQTLSELRSLSNRDLADLGIHRSMITRVALEAAFGK